MQKEKTKKKKEKEKQNSKVIVKEVTKLNLTNKIIFRRPVTVYLPYLIRTNL